MSAKSDDRRKGQRRSGVGRRIQGDRRTPEKQQPVHPGSPPRKQDRRMKKRRSQTDRRRPLDGHRPN